MEFIVLDWMSGKRAYFKTEEEAVQYFDDLMISYNYQDAEFDMSCFKILKEHNNVDG